MECLCVMHEATPYGHLLLNGARIEDDALARMIGTSVDELCSLKEELRKAGVLSVTREGVIFSRRMTKDFAKAQKGRKAVNRRWSQTTETEGNSDPPNRLPKALPSTQKPEARSQKPEREEGQAAPPSTETGEVGTAVLALLRAAGMKRQLDDFVSHPQGIIALGQPVIAWFAAGIPLPQIESVIRSVAARQSYKPPSSLAYFNPAVMEAKTAPASPTSPKDDRISRWDALTRGYDAPIQPRKTG